MAKAKAVLYFMLWLIPAVLLCAAYILVADRVCHVEPASKQHGQEHKGADGRYAEINGHRYQRDAPTLASLLKVAQSEPTEPQGAAKPDGKDSKPERWITKFFCEAKALDVALVLFTYCLVIVTGWLVYATGGLREETATLAVFAKQQAQDMKSSIAVAQQAAEYAGRSAELAARRASLSLPGDH